MRKLKDFTTDQLKNRIWQLSSGMIPSGGFPGAMDIEAHRDELERRTGLRKGFHE